MEEETAPIIDVQAQEEGVIEPVPGVEEIPSEVSIEEAPDTDETAPTEAAPAE